MRSIIGADAFERALRPDADYLTALLDLRAGDLAQHERVLASKECEMLHMPPAERVRRVLSAAAKWAVVYAAAAVVCKHARFLNLHAGRSPFMAASRVTSAAHALVAFVAAARLIPKREVLLAPAKFARGIGARPNTRAEERLIELSLGYFCFDTCYMLAYERDPMFFAHHAVTLAIWPGALRAGRGSELVVLGLLLGESTGPLLNAWWLAKRGGHAALAQPLSRLFTAAFLLVRLGVLPALNVPFARAAFSGQYDERLGRGRARLWGYLVTAAVLGGFAWAKQLLAGLLADLAKSKQKRLR